ncbi:MAG: hypothetical protein R3E12_01585 [Candidatus Eisenbacteria bacterium]
MRLQSGGWRQQLETLFFETGDIVDEGTYGPDSPPDWDGSDFNDIVARHPEARLTHSWRDDGSSFLSRQVDYVLHTGSVSEGSFLSSTLAT